MHVRKWSLLIAGVLLLAVTSSSQAVASGGATVLHSRFKGGSVVLGINKGIGKDGLPSAGVYLQVDTYQLVFAESRYVYNSDGDTVGIIQTYTDTLVQSGYTLQATGQYQHASVTGTAIPVTTC